MILDKIVVKVSDLFQKAKRLANDRMDYVELTLMEADDELPACVLFNAISKRHDYEIIDYEEIDAVDSKITEEFN